MSRDFSLPMRIFCCLTEVVPDSARQRKGGAKVVKLVSFDLCFETP